MQLGGIEKEQLDNKAQFPKTCSNRPHGVEENSREPGKLLCERHSQQREQNITCHSDVEGRQTRLDYWQSCASGPIRGHHSQEELNTFLPVGYKISPYKVSIDVYVRFATTQAL